MCFHQGRGGGTVNKKLDEVFFYRAAIILMIVAAVVDTLLRIITGALYISEELVYTISDYLQTALCILGALALFLMKDRSLRRILLVLGVMACIMSLFSAYMMLVQYAGLMEYDVYNFVNGALQLYIGVFLIINLSLFASRVSNSTMVMFFCMLGMIILKVIDMMTPIRFDTEPEFILEVIAYSIPSILLLVLAMVILRTDSIKAETLLFNIKNSFSDIRDSAVPVGVTMLRSDLKTIADSQDRGAWDHGCEFRMKSAYSNEYKAVFDRKGERTLMYLSPAGDGAVIDAHRLVLRGISTDSGDLETCDTARFYGEDGFYMQFIVEDSLQGSQDDQ